MSQAIVFSAYGSPDVLTLADMTVPPPGPGQVRVRVKAAGVQPFDCLFRGGGAARWMPASFPQQLGNEFAGVIKEVGEGVTAFAVGDHVLGWVTLTAYAEHVVVAVNQIVTKPEKMPWAEAGVLSASGQTADTALEELGVDKGDAVLIHAAAGGVGTFAVQIARSRGATVIGTASERNHEYLRALGAIPVAYGEGLADRVRALAPDGVDAALDAAGTEEALRASLELVSDRARIGTITFQPAATQLRIRQLSTKRSASRLAELTDLYQRRELHIFLHRAFPLAEAAQAHYEVESGHVRGKVVLTMDGPSPEPPVASAENPSSRE